MSTELCFYVAPYRQCKGSHVFEWAVDSGTLSVYSFRSHARTNLTLTLKKGITFRELKRQIIFWGFDMFSSPKYF